MTMKTYKPPVYKMPSARNFLLDSLEGLIISFKKGNHVAFVEVADLYSRADSLDRQNALIIRSEGPSDG